MKEHSYHTKVKKKHCLRYIGYNKVGIFDDIDNMGWLN